MRAAVLAELGRFQLREQEVPRPTGGALLVRVAACGVCGSDLRIFRHGHARIRLPHVLGHEIAGTVAEVGPAAEGFRAGDRVAVMPKVFCGSCRYCLRGLTNLCERGLSFGYALPGGFAEYLLVPEEGVRQGAVLLLPPGMDREEAAIVEPFACCLRVQRDAPRFPGRTVAVIGGGPIGTMHGRLACHFDATQVILIERSERRLGAADRAAFGVVIDGRGGDAPDAVRRETEGRGADLVVVACSSREAQIEALAIVGKAGRIEFFSGLPVGSEPIPIDTNALHYNEITMHATHGAGKEDCAEALALLAGGAVVVSDLISHRYPLSEIQEAFGLLEAAEASKVLITPDGMG